MSFPSSWQRPGKGREQSLSDVFTFHGQKLYESLKKRQICPNGEVIFLTPKARKALVSLGHLFVLLSTLLWEGESKPPSPELSSS